MQAEAEQQDDLIVQRFVDRVEAAPDEPAARLAYRAAFADLLSQLPLHPIGSSSAMAVFESASSTVRRLAARCLPLATAVAMHLYPLCALQCVPIPLWHPVRFKRALLLQMVRSRSLILANAGSERSRGTDRPLLARRDGAGIRIDGTCDYMSLGSVADIVLFKAQLERSSDTVLCAAALKGPSVQIGRWKFRDSLRLSDTSPVTFDDHPVPQGRYLLLPSGEKLQCIADYQRCWFHLFLADIYLARLDRLHRIWGQQPGMEFFIDRNDAGRLREYSLHLLDGFASRPDIESLLRTTSALKLRVSLMTGKAIEVLRALPATDARRDRIAADIAELSCIRFQPTADDRILQTLGAPDAARTTAYFSSVCSQNI